MSLGEQYKYTLQSERAWSYYELNSSAIHDYTLFDIILNDCTNTFILDCLKRGGKGDISCAKRIKTLSTLRKQHTISCFLLGNILYNDNNEIKKLVDKEIEKIRDCKEQESSTKRFRYMWMLISLFHDLGYEIEDGNESIEDKEVKPILFMKIDLIFVSYSLTYNYHVISHIIFSA